MRIFFDWLWRAAMLAAIAWVALELRTLRLDLEEPAADQTTASASGEEDDDTISAVRDDLDKIDQKINAIMVVIARSK